MKSLSRSRWWLMACALCAALLLAACGSLSTGSSGTSTRAAPSVSTKGFPKGTKGSGIFTDTCTYSHEAPDDPILMPGMTGMSMQHDFYGNTGTNASSTPKTLVGGHTSCRTSADASAYWSPVLYQNGQALQPKSALIYWRQNGKVAKNTVAMPTGMTMIAGNEKATSPQALTVVRWTCEGDKNGKDDTATPHDCTAGHDLRLIVDFPSCWNGTDLNGATQTNVVYPMKDGSCPASHPKSIPQIIFHVYYPTTSAANLTFSMSPTMQDSTDTAHVDFMNGWDESLMARNVQACIVPGIRCGQVTGSGAVPKGGKKEA